MTLYDLLYFSVGRVPNNFQRHFYSFFSFLSFVLSECRICSQKLLKAIYLTDTSLLLYVRGCEKAMHRSWIRGAKEEELINRDTTLVLPTAEHGMIGQGLEII